MQLTYCSPLGASAVNGPGRLTPSDFWVQAPLLRRMIDAGLEAILVKVAAIGAL